MHLNTDFMGEGHCFVILIVNTNALPTSLLCFHSDYVAQELFVMGGYGWGGGVKERTKKLLLLSEFLWASNRTFTKQVFFLNAPFISKFGYSEPPTPTRPHCKIGWGEDHMHGQLGCVTVQLCTSPVLIGLASTFIIDVKLKRHICLRVREVYRLA